jgi:putative copper resistance protein D
VVITGVINSVLILGIGPFDPSSPYQVLLAAKVVIVGLMIGLALINRYRVMPRLRARPNVSHVLVRNSMAELALGFVVITLVSLFGLLEP